MEKKQRVPKGEKYFFIRANNYLEFTTDSTFDVGCEANDDDFERGNYFLTERDAVNKIVQLNAVLKGADVIEQKEEETVYAEPIDAFYIRPSVENYRTPRQ